MKAEDIIAELSKTLPQNLSKDLISDFLELRKDVQTQTLSRASAGKLVETTVQCLEFLESGSYSSPPAVDAYLKNLESRPTILNDDLKIVLSRIARSIYTLRNKRNIVHKGNIDANLYDLKYIYSSTQWILTEFIRQHVTGDIHKAGRIVEFIQLPVSSIIESTDGRKIIHAKLPVKEEVLLVLYSYYPTRVSELEISKSIDRRPRNSVYKAIGALWDEKLIHENDKLYALTQTGFTKSEIIIGSCSAT